MKEYTIECRRATSSSFKTVKCAHLAEAKKLAAKLFGKTNSIHIFVNGEHAAYRFAGFRKWFETGIA